MANPEHLAVIEQGVDAWNDWVSKHGGVLPNLEGADLSGQNLRGADFAGAKLSGANFTGSSLDNALFRYAGLNHAILYDAHLSKADLTGASISKADFGRAWLEETKFSSNVFSETNVELAILRDATFRNVDFRGAKGLETVRHFYSSSIDIDTIFRSHGCIPEVFLRGCGVPEPFIVQMRALITSTEPIQFYSCFISYSSKDQDFANRLHADLQQKGVRCWFAPEDLKIGDRFRDRIDESIRLHDKLLLILSENSVSSPWVSDEVEAAIEREHREGRTVLFPIKIDDAVMGSEQAWAAAIRRTRHIGDFTRWKDHDSYQKAFERLLRDLKAEEKK
jgi:hypothetical protein